MRIGSGSIIDSGSVFCAFEGSSIGLPESAVVFSGVVIPSVVVSFASAMVRIVVKWL